MFFFFGSTVLSTSSASKRGEAEARLSKAGIPCRVKVLETRSDCVMDSRQYAAPQGGSLRRQYLIRVPRKRREEALALLAE